MARGVEGSGGIMDDERLLSSDGTWHRLQRQRVPFETSCFYTAEPELPYGCQYAMSRESVWRDDAVRAAERSVLLDFYTALSGAQWRSSDNWDASSDPCWDFWYGVTCDEHGHVIALELVDNRLAGTLPLNFGDLTNLLKLDLSSTWLEHHSNINVDVNRIQGAMPSLAKATRLEELEVSGNEITALPEDLYLNANTLRTISASNNFLTSFPANLQAFRELHTLELQHNMIADQITSAFGFLRNAWFVHLTDNQLFGSIDANIVGMTRIHTFDVSHNLNLAGEIPVGIRDAWAEAEYISIFNTSVSGQISSLCIDLPYCHKYMYTTHEDLTWAMAEDVPDIVKETWDLAQSGR